MIIERIKVNEGFVGTCYKDTRGKDTIGYGTLLPIDETEGEILLRRRLDAKINNLLAVKPFIINLEQDKQNVLYEMAYQLGVSGLLKFKKMWEALEVEDYDKASYEMLDSKWANKLLTEHKS